MLQKRLIVCLDVRDGRTTKGVKFRDNVDVGDPVEMARFCYEQGADELVFYDITASAERRPIMIEVVRRVAETIFIPFSVGGGIASVEHMRAVLLAGAEKVSVNSPAVRSPRLITEGAALFGSQCVVLGMDALAWAHEAERLGAGEIVLNSIDADGTRQGYELRLTRMISQAVGIPVVASGGAGTPDHVVDVLREGAADAALVASMVHFGTYRIADIKQRLRAAGIPVRIG